MSEELNPCPHCGEAARIKELEGLLRECLECMEESWPNRPITKLVKAALMEGK